VKQEKRDTLWLRAKAHAHLRAALDCLLGVGAGLEITDPDLRHRVALVFRELEETSQELRIRYSGEKGEEPERLTRPCPKGCDSEVWARWRFLIPENLPDFTAKLLIEQFQRIFEEAKKVSEEIVEIRELAENAKLAKGKRG